MTTYYTTDFNPIFPAEAIIPLQAVAFCDAPSRREARAILRAAIVKAGCSEPRPWFEIKTLGVGQSFTINGNY